MHVVEPKKYEEGWRMVCRNMATREILPVSDLYPTSTRARRDPVAVAWAEYIPAVGAEALDALRWAWGLCDAGEVISMGSPVVVIPAYREAQG